MSTKSSDCLSSVAEFGNTGRSKLVHQQQQTICHRTSVRLSLCMWEGQPVRCVWISMKFSARIAFFGTWRAELAFGRDPARIECVYRSDHRMLRPTYRVGLPSISSNCILYTYLSVLWNLIGRQEWYLARKNPASAIPNFLLRKLLSDPV